VSSASHKGVCVARSGMTFMTDDQSVTDVHDITVHR